MGQSLTIDSCKYKISLKKQATLKSCTSQDEVFEVPAKISVGNSKQIDVLKIHLNAFSQSNVAHVKFHPDSQIEVVNKCCFVTPTIKCVDLPPKFRNFADSIIEIDSSFPLFRIVNDNKYFIQDHNGIIYRKYDMNIFSIPGAKKKLLIRESVEKINKLACFINNDLETIKFPSTLKEIDTLSFHRNNKLKHIFFHKNSSLKIIKNAAFTFCLIQEISFPKSLEVIGYMAFACCFFLNKISFPKDSNLREIAIHAFYTCDIQRLEFPKSLTTIGRLAFDDNRNLKFVSFPPDSKIESIGSGAFTSQKLEELLFPRAQQDLVPVAFYRCGKISHIEEISETYRRIFYSKR